jgi:hypothetical protein
MREAEGAMRNIIGLSSLALLALMSASGSCRAQVIYNDTVLRGCYSFLTTSVDTESRRRGTGRRPERCASPATAR